MSTKQTGLESIFAKNVRGDFNIHITMQSVTLTNFVQTHPSTKNVKMVFSVAVWIWMSHLKFKFFKNTCSTITAWIYVRLLL